MESAAHLALTPNVPASSLKTPSCPASVLWKGGLPRISIALLALATNGMKDWEEAASPKTQAKPKPRPSQELTAEKKKSLFSSFILAK